jgi:hypothetical protein
MARPAKLSSTCGWKSRQGKPSWRLVADPSAGEKSLVPSGVTEVSSGKEEGASERPVTQVNPRRGPVRLSARKGWGSRAAHVTAKATDCGAGARRKPTPGRTPAGFPRGIGDGTFEQPTAEQERPSSVALQWARFVYKAEVESMNCREGVRRGHSTREAKTNNFVEGRLSTLTEVSPSYRLRVMSSSGPIPITACGGWASDPCGKDGRPRTNLLGSKVIGKPDACATSAKLLRVTTRRMREDPSESSCRGGLQATVSGCGQKRRS